MSGNGRNVKEVAILQKIKEEKDILFGAFSNKQMKEDKTKKWQKVTELAQSLDIAAGKNWQYERDTVWGNWRKRTMVRKVLKHDIYDELIICKCTEANDYIFSSIYFRRKETMLMPLGEAGVRKLS